MSEPRSKVPNTEARKQLVAWLKGPGRSQGKLATLLKKKQQSVSQWVRRVARPEADLAADLQIATGGVVKADDWLTAAERVARNERRAAITAAA
jgi:DNA-binding transcriptional regulator YdaS (Cro superfamily)